MAAARPPRTATACACFLKDRTPRLVGGSVHVDCRERLVEGTLYPPSFGHIGICATRCKKVVRRYFVRVAGDEPARGPRSGRVCVRRTVRPCRHVMDEDGAAAAGTPRHKRNASTVCVGKCACWASQNSCNCHHEKSATARFINSTPLNLTASSPCTKRFRSHLSMARDRERLRRPYAVKRPKGSSRRTRCGASADPLTANDYAEETLRRQSRRPGLHRPGRGRRVPRPRRPSGAASRRRSGCSTAWRRSARDAS